MATNNSVVYTRVSSDEQLKGMSLDFQREDCLAYAERKGLQVLRVFEERGESAKYADRPQLIELMEFCRRNKRTVDVLIVWKLDRLSRNQINYYYFKRKLQDLGIQIMSATEPTMEDADSLSAKIFETFTALQAEMDNTIRTERARRGLEARINSGIHPWRPPLGYHPDPNRPHLSRKSTPDQPDPVFFPIIQAGLRLYSEGTMTKDDLFHYYERAGLFRLRLVQPRPQLVHKFLNEYLDYYAGYIKNPWTGQRIRGQHQSMLTDAEYHRIIAARDGKAATWRVPHHRHNPLFPLRGTLICADCGRPYTASRARGKLGGRFAYYHCYNRACPSYGKSIRKEVVEANFARLVKRIEIDERHLNTFMDHLYEEFERRHPEGTYAAPEAQQALLRLEQRRRAIFEMREEGAYTHEEFMERKTKIEADMNALRVRIDRLTENRLNFQKIWSEAKRILGDIVGEWGRMTDEKMRVFQQVAFPQGIPYHLENGFGTHKMCCILAAIRRFESSNNTLSRCRVESWNPLLEDMTRIASLNMDTASATNPSNRRRRPKNPQATSCNLHHVHL